MQKMKTFLLNSLGSTISSMPASVRKPAPKRRTPKAPDRRAAPPAALVKLALMAFALVTTIAVVQSSGVVARLFQ